MDQVFGVCAPASVASIRHAGDAPQFTEAGLETTSHVTRAADKEHKPNAAVLFQSRRLRVDELKRKPRLTSLSRTSRLGTSGKVFLRNDLFLSGVWGKSFNKIYVCKINTLTSFRSSLPC